MMLTALLALGLAWQAVSPEAVQHAQAGLLAQKEGRLTDAIVEFKRVTELAPTLAAAFVNLGAAYLQNHQYAEAVAPLKKSLELNSDLVGAQQMLGIALLAQGYVAESIPYLEQSHDQLSLGIAQLKTGKFSDAIVNLNAALEKHPNDPEILYYLGRASGLLSQNAFNTLESAYPNSARTHQSLAENYAVLRQIPAAEREYGEALRLQPNTPGLHLELGILYANAADWPKAEEQFRAESALQPGDAEAAYRLGNALLQQGKTADALAELTRANQLRPQMPETLYALGKAESLTGNTTQAEKDWLAVLALEKNSPLASQAHFGLAGLYRKEGKTIQAQQELQAYKQLQPSK